MQSRLMQKAWETILPKVSRRGDVEGDLSALLRSFTQRKVCSELDPECGRAALNHALAVAKEMRRYQFSNMGPSIPEAVRKYEHLFFLAKQLRSALPDAPDVLIDLACGTIQSEWMR